MRKTAVMQSVMENIKIQENYFYKLDNSKEVKVIWKKYDKANILEIGVEYPTAIVDLDRLIGIPITKEWLIKFGFIETNYDKDNTWLNLKYRFLNFASDQSVNFEKVYLIVNRMEIICSYVHELQNLYFAMTQRELTVA